MREYALDKFELLHRYALQQDCHEYGMKLDVTRIAHVSTLSKEGHKVFAEYRKMLTRGSSGKTATVSQKKAVRSVASKLFALGAEPKK